MIKKLSIHCSLSQLATKNKTSIVISCSLYTQKMLKTTKSTIKMQLKTNKNSLILHYYQMQQSSQKTNTFPEKPPFVCHWMKNKKKKNTYCIKTINTKESDYQQQNQVYSFVRHKRKK